MSDESIAGRYRLLEPLGRGAMSSVWHAYDDELARDVAIKQLAPTADRGRFEREARAVAALAHPNICNLYDYGEADGKPYMVLEYLPGGTLEDRLKAGRLSDAETDRYATEIAAGLAHAHEHGVVHRDLKPANVLFDSEDRAKIADFGIARMGDAGTLTEAGTVLGTAAYISPEQAAGLQGTAASDVYSFGVLLFRMLSGRLPFISDNAMELVRMNRDELPPTVADVRRDAPPVLAATADAALRKDPATRPADGAALLAALRDAGATEATMVLPRVRPPRRRSYLPAIVVLAVVLLLGGAALALALSTGGGGSGSPPRGPTASLTVPSVPTVSTATSPATSGTPLTTAATTTRPTTTHATTTRPTTTHATTAHTTTRRTTTAHATTSHVTTAPVTTAPPPPPPTTTAPATTGTTTAATTTTSTNTTAATTSVAATTTS